MPGVQNILIAKRLQSISHAHAMTAKALKSKLDTLQVKGLNPTLRAMAENIILYRKWGELGGYKLARDILLKKTREYQPDFHSKLFNILTNA